MSNYLLESTDRNTVVMSAGTLAADDYQIDSFLETNETKSLLPTAFDYASQAATNQIPERLLVYVHDLLLEDISKLFNSFQGEISDDVLRDPFTRRLISIIGNNGSITPIALNIMKDAIINNQVQPIVAANLLELFGLLSILPYRKERRVILEECLLNSSSSWVRDGAIKGISFLDEPWSIPAVEEAISKEEIPVLRDYMKRILKQLIGTKAELGRQ